MRFLLPLLLVIGQISFAQHKKIVVMGSSSAAGSGASHTDSAWAYRLQKHFRQNTSAGDLDTAIYNIAGYGQNTYQQMPTGWVSPIPGRHSVQVNNNVTKALSFSPDIVIINLPTNDVAQLDVPWITPVYYKGNN